MRVIEPSTLESRIPAIRVGASSRPLRVLHVGKFYYPHRGGIETHLKDLCERLLACGVDVRVVVSNEGAHDEETTISGVPVKRLSTPFKFASAPISRGLVREIRRSDADIIHIHVPNPPALLAHLVSGRRRRGGRMIVTHHSDVIKQRFLNAAFKPIEDAALKECDAIIASSPNYVESSPTLLARREKCHVIPFGVDPERFNKCDEEAISSIRRRYDSRIVLAVGRLVYYKGFEYLIDAMRDVNAHLVIIGKGPLKGKLEQAARERGVAERVHVLGEVPDALSYFHAADVFALPSIARSEAFAIVQLEAMACGTPVVNTDLASGVPFVSRDRETGLTVPPADAQALARALNALLSDDDLRLRYGQAARERVKQEFSLTQMTERTLSLYRQVLERESVS